MTRTLEQAITYANTHPPTRPVFGGAWATRTESYCEDYVYNLGGFTQGFPSAYAAAMHSGPLDKDWTTAQNGEIHYFAGVDGLGHDGFQLPGGFACASTTFAGNPRGGTGYFASVGAYIAGRPYMAPVYLGHTFRHGTETLAQLTPSGGGNTPLVPKRSNRMFVMLMVVDNNGPLWTLINMQTAGIIQVRDQAQANSLAITSGVLTASVTNASVLADAFDLAERSSGQKIHTI